MAPQVGKKKAFGNPLVGTWYCPKCRYTIFPNKLKKQKNSFVWSDKNASTLGGFVGPHCKSCGTPMEYDEYDEAEQRLVH